MIAFLLLSAVVASASASLVPVPLDTPEVALAKAQHLAIVEQTKLRNALGVPVVPYAAAYSIYGAPVVVNGQVQDTPEVAALKAKHLAIQASEAARNQAGVAYGPVLAAYGPYAGPYGYPYAAYGAYGPAPVVINGQVQDTPEVAAAKAQHLAALHAAEARASHAY